ncbi:MAG: carboxylesterase family protein [Gammaproteobacteria bacterium]|nr:carboxylesterase family protein [Gammaproteobacteria bacterium]
MVVALGTAGTPTQAQERAQGLAAEAAERIEDAGIEVRRDVVYADLPGVDRERLTLDLYMPSDAAGAKARRPIVLYVHGGGWIAGTKAQAFLQPLALVPEGFVYASANYRLRPDATVAEMAQSVASAAGWLTRHADEFDGDPHTLFLVGHSAGAHLVSLLGTNETFLEEAGVHPASVRGVVSLDTAVYDLPKLLDETEATLHQRVFGEEPDAEAVSPWHHVEYGAPHPAFLIFYSEGRPAAATQTIPFANRLNDAGHVATVLEAVGRDHGELNNMLGTDADQPTAQIVEFLRQHADASDYREATLDTGLVPSPLEYSVLRPGPAFLVDDASAHELPVLLFLHGGGGDRTALKSSRDLFERAWRDGVLPPMVVATPSSTALSYYMDFHDGSERWTTLLAGEFPHQIGERHGGDPSRVAIAGYSMGGVGALRVSFKNPDAFFAVAGMAAGIEPALEFDDLPAWYEGWKRPRLGTRFGTPVDPAFWAANNPASVAAADPDRLRDSKLAILVECGAEDQFHNHVGNEFLHQVLTEQRIPHEYRLVLGEAHVPVAPERMLAALDFIGRALRGPGEAKRAARDRSDAMLAPMSAMGPPD